MSDGNEASHLTLAELAHQIAAVNERASAMQRENDRLHQRLARLEGQGSGQDQGQYMGEEISEVGAAVSRPLPDSPSAGPDGGPEDLGDRPVSRRGALMALGAAAAGGAGLALGSAIVSAEPAAAANGGPVLLGESNTATSLTTVTNSGSSAGFAAFSKAGENALLGVVVNGSGIAQPEPAAVAGGTGQSDTYGVYGASASSDGVHGIAGSLSGLLPGINGPFGVAGESGEGGAAGVAGLSGGNSGNGVVGIAQGPGGFGVVGLTQGSATTGVLGIGSSDPGVPAVGVVATSTAGASLALVPFATSTLPPAPKTGQFIVLDDGSLHYCYANHEWTQLNNGIVTLPAPVRIVDTVAGTGIAAGALAPGGSSPSTAPVHVTDVLTGANGIPSQAGGLVGNFAISGVNGAVMNGLGVAAIFPAGVPTPKTANINAGAGCFAISNTVTVALGTGSDAGKLGIVWYGGGNVLPAQAFFDVTGYFL